MARLEGTLVYWGDKLVEVATLGEDKVAFTPFIPNLQIEFLLVGGGGAGGWPSSRTGGGGGAGRMLSGSASIAPGNISLTIGDGGVAPTTSVAVDGGNTSTTINSVSWIAPGGGGGGTGGTANAANGGSGGGAGGTGVTALGGGNDVTGEPIAGFGNDGGDNSSGQSTGAGGGGAGSAGTNNGAAGGNGYAWVDGVTYARGGTGGAVGSTPSTPAGAGSGGSGGYFQSGVGQFAGSNGNKGICVIRYAGTQTLASGGTITQSGGYVYHTFTSNGTFTY